MAQLTTCPKPVVLAAAAHPDDIEFMMAGTLALLKARGWEIHYLNVANGSCGTVELPVAEIVRIRAAEAAAAAALLGATHHPSLVDDIQIYYCPELVARLAAIVRRVRPTILLVPSLVDYMEDHQNTSRLMVTAAFCRGMPNFASVPPVPAVSWDMAVYHALPYGLADQLRRPVHAGFYVDVSSCLDTKRRMLACHRSQKEWLDRSQGVDSYLDAMAQITAEMGRQSGRFAYAEGWTRHSHAGFAATPEFDPLAEALAGQVAAGA